MRNPYISIFSTHNLPEKTKELGTLWELFVTSQREEIVSDKLRKNILDSWKRCQDTGVDPRQLQTKPALDTADLHQVSKESELYHTAKPILDDLFYKMKGTGYLSVLADHKGRLIYLNGDRSVLKAAEKMNFIHGMDWSENAAGTNAIGTSLLTRMPIQIFSAEHFCEGCHPWTCSSAPITHPFTKEIIGAVDFTGLWDHAQPHTLGLAITVAQAIEMELSYAYLKVNHFLKEAFFRGLGKWENDQLLVINHAFIVINCSKELQEAFGVELGGKLDQYHPFQPLIHEIKRSDGLANQLTLTKELTLQNYKATSIEKLSFMGMEAGFMVVLKKHKTLPHAPIPTLNKSPWKEWLGTSAGFLSAMNRCSKASQSTVPILLLGESGTGKEKAAQFIHKTSQRADKPFIAINCGAIQKELIGSELFGYESGTFTGGAKEGKKGRFEEANGGTLFLDEIGEMPLDLQVHLLRVLQEKEITRLGSSKPISINVRIVAATHKNLYDLCKQGKFRADLLFRLNVVTVTIPPLRERKEDISLLSEHFLHLYAIKYEKKTCQFTDEAKTFFHEYHWPGNIRELQNVLEHAVIFSDSSFVAMQDLPSYLFDQDHSENIPCTQQELNKEQIQLIKLLEETGWNLSAVAKKMQIARTTLYRKLKKYQLKKG